MFLSIDTPINVITYLYSTAVPPRGEVVILGRDASVNLSITKAVATRSNAVSITALPAITTEDEIDDRGPIPTASPNIPFQVSQIGCDNNSDMYNSVFVFKKGTLDYVKVSMKSKIRDDLVDAINAIAAM